MEMFASILTLDVHTNTTGKMNVEDITIGLFWACR